MEVIDGVKAVEAMLAQNQAAAGQPDPPSLTELLRSDRGLDLGEQWRVTMGQTRPRKQTQRGPLQTPGRNPETDPVDQKMLAAQETNP